MDMDYLFDFLATTQLTFFIAIAALIVAVVALFSASSATVSYTHLTLPTICSV